MIVAVVALAIVLPLVGSKSSGSPSSSGKGGSTTAAGANITGTYVAIATSNIPPLYLSLVQTHAHLSGKLIIPSVSGSSPQKVVDESEPLTGTVSGVKFTLELGGASKGDSASGTISGHSLAINFGGDEAFNPGTLSQFHKDVSADSSTILSQDSASGDRASQSNLINGLTELKALYQVTQAYSSNGHPYGVSVVTQQAPEFDWTTGNCSATNMDCLSFMVLDLASRGDAQGVAATAFSAATGTCWYAIDVEVAPQVIAGDSSALESKTHGPNASVKAGVFYAKSAPGVREASCSASSVLKAQKMVGWGDSFSSAGALFTS
jgi:hypothetical protein